LTKLRNDELPQFKAGCRFS